MSDSRLPFDTLAQPNPREQYKGEFMTFGDAWYLKQHGCTDPVPVTLVEDPEGKYMTWLSAEPNGDREPHFTLWAGLFNMQFPYGYRAEEEKGHGRAVRVRVDVRDPS